jgi:hypothetical protein
MEAAEALGVDYKRTGLEHAYRLKETALSNAKEISPPFGTYK